MDRTRCYTGDLEGDSFSISETGVEEKSFNRPKTTAIFSSKRVLLEKVDRNLTESKIILDPLGTLLSSSSTLDLREKKFSSETSVELSGTVSKISGVFVKGVQKRIKPTHRPWETLFWQKKREEVNFECQVRKVGEILEDKKEFVSSFLKGSEVLIVDDASSVRFVMSAFFGKVCSEVHLHEKENGEASLEALYELIPLMEKGRFIILVMDNDMPGIGGIETIRRIRMEFPQYENQIVIIAHTSDGNKKINEMIEFGANTSFSKGSSMAYDNFVEILYKLFTGLSH